MSEKKVVKITKPKLNVPLLRKIQKHILEEPRRFFMNWYVARRADALNGKTFAGDFGHEQEFPPCGTAACIAGWANILSGQQHNPSNSETAQDVLGITWEESDSLFGLGFWPPRYHKLYRAAGTVEKRASVAARRIDYFIKHRK